VWKKVKADLDFSPFYFTEDYPAISASLVSLSTSGYSRAHVAARKKKEGITLYHVTISILAEGHVVVTASSLCSLYGLHWLQTFQTASSPGFTIAVPLAFNLVRDLETVSWQML
jgi:hypothetical protein